MRWGYSLLTHRAFVSWPSGRCRTSTIRMLASVQRYRAATSVAPGSNGRSLSGSWSVAHVGGLSLGPRSEGPHGAFRAEHASLRLYGIERRGRGPFGDRVPSPGARAPGAQIRPSLGVGQLNRIGARPDGTEGVPEPAEPRPLLGTGPDPHLLPTPGAPGEGSSSEPPHARSSTPDVVPARGNTRTCILSDAGLGRHRRTHRDRGNRVDARGRLRVIAHGQNQSLGRDARPHASISVGSPIPEVPLSTYCVGFGETDSSWLIGSGFFRFKS